MFKSTHHKKSVAPLASDADISNNEIPSSAGAGAQASSIEAPLIQRLMAANAYVQRALVLGSSNRIEDLERTGDFSKLANQYLWKGRYKKVKAQQPSKSSKTRQTGKWAKESGTIASKWEKEHLSTKGFVITRFRGSKEQYEQNYGALEKSPALWFGVSLALATEQQRIGNCSQRSYLALKYLWQHSQHIERLECIGMTKFDHALLIINRKQDSIQLEPSTWGENCYCLDSWYKDGIVFKGVDFHKYMNDIYRYVRYQKMRVSGATEMPTAETSTPYLFKVQLNVSPKTTPYPRGNPLDDRLKSDFKLVCGVPSSEFEAYLKREEDDLSKHQRQFVSTLKMIRGGHHTLFKFEKETDMPVSTRRTCTL